MNRSRFTTFVAGGAISVGALLALTAPIANAQTKDQAQTACENGGGTFTEGSKQPTGGYLGQCCVKNVATGANDCKSVVYTAMVADPGGSTGPVKRFPGINRADILPVLEQGGPAAEPVRPSRTGTVAVG
jgi:hypothetical protein